MLFIAFQNLATDKVESLVAIMQQNIHGTNVNPDNVKAISWLAKAGGSKGDRSGEKFGIFYKPHFIQ